MEILRNDMQFISFSSGICVIFTDFRFFFFSLLVFCAKNKSLLPVYISALSKSLKKLPGVEVGGK